MSPRRSPAGLEGGNSLPLGARLTRSWSRAYTYGLPAEIALARRDEIAATCTTNSSTPLRSRPPRCPG